MPDGRPSLAAPGGLAGLASIAREVGDLKRTRDARSPETLATLAFRRAWEALAGGADAHAVALGVTADALAAARLGGIDASILDRCGLSPAAARSVLQAGVFQMAAAAPQPLAAQLRDHVALPFRAGRAPAFVDALARQPRAGATCPGKPRIALEPAESHADHCLLVAVLGVVASADYGADPATVFLAGLAHHLHNAVLPDSGFAGEVLLGDHLRPIMERLFAEGLAQLDDGLAPSVRAALAVIGDADTPEGRAFHAADVIDRVQQMAHFARVAAFTVDQALDDLQLVHAGPVQAFHHQVLREAGLP
jgi:5'-deoxynucleotidase YfbR-like HD superfamily hydrolase